LWARILEVLFGILNAGKANAVPRLLGGYWLSSELGRGRIGPTYLAIQLVPGRKVALKSMQPRWAGDATFVARFTREAYAALQITDHNLAQIHDFGDERGIPYFTSEIVDGQSLNALIRAKGRLDIEKAVVYVLQAARGLRCAHQQGILHRDIKPQNLLLNRQGLIKLSDVGLSKIPESAEADEAVGTPTAIRIDTGADICSLGCTLYALLTGMQQVESGTVADILGGQRTQPINPPRPVGEVIPQALSAIVRKMVAAQPEDRYASASDVIAALETFLGISSSLPFNPLDEHASLLDQSVRAYHGSQTALLRSRVKSLFFGACLALAILCLISARPLAGVGFASLGFLTALADFVLAGIRRQSALFVKLRELIATERMSEWLTALAALAILIVLLMILKLFWLLLGLGFLAIGIVAALHAAFDRRIDAERAKSLAEVERMLRSLRLNGVDEDALRRFVWIHGGTHAEEFYEALFGYDEKREARRRFNRSERSGPRSKFASWRDPIADWLDATIAARRAASEIVKLQRIEEKSLESLGENLVTARRKGQRSAEAMVALAAEIRKTNRAGDGEYAVNHSIAAAMREAALKPEKVLVQRERGLLPERRRSVGLATIVNMIVGPNVRFLFGAALLAGCIAWMHQNAMISPEHAGALVEAAKSGDVDAIRSHAQAQVAHAREAAAKRTDPLALPVVPAALLNLVSSFGAGVSGLILIASSVFGGPRIALFAIPAAAVPLLGPQLGLPSMGGLEPSVVPIIIGLALMIAGVVFGRE
jgi:hypothetical protein